MKLEITGRHVEITPSIRTFIEEHLKKLPRLLGDNAQVHVVLGVEKRRHRCEIVLKAKTAQAACTATTTDMYLSITRAAHNLGQRVLKLQQRRVDVKRRRKPETSGNDGRRERGPAIPDVIEEGVSKKPMAIEEALLNLPDSALGFVVYRDAETRALHVVYRRKDGHIGLIRG